MGVKYDLGYHICSGSDCLHLDRNENLLIHLIERLLAVKDVSNIKRVERHESCVAEILHNTEALA
jgi:hypothetical protein